MTKVSSRSRKNMVNRKRIARINYLKRKSLIKNNSSCGTCYGYAMFTPNMGSQDRFYLAGPSTNKVYVRSLRASNNKSYRR